MATGDLLPTDGLSGPALYTNLILNAKWVLAQDWYRQSYDFSDDAQADIGTAPQMLPANLDKTLDKVDPPKNLTFDDPNAVMAYFNSTNAQLSARIDQAFQDILGIAFPDMDVFGAALAWCKRAITQGGTGINTGVEAALWERGRARILKQADRDTASATEKYARAGWPLPPGAMLNDIAAIRQDSRDKLAEQSRDIAIKSFDTEIENVRFAIKTVGDLFGQALNAVGEYVKTVMMGPQIAMQMATSMSGLKNEAARTLVALYQAQSAALDPFVRLSITDAQLHQSAAEANLRARSETARMRVDVALAKSKMAADAVSASLNAISAGMSNTMSSSVAL